MSKTLERTSNYLQPMPEDLTQIRGIGKCIENRLHQSGILTYAQLAALKPEEVADLVGDMIGMSANRVAVQDWLGQARDLAAKTQPANTAIETIAPNGRMHYAVFTVELLLDEDNDVRRTRVKHIQSQMESTWAGWEGRRLVSFFTENAGLKTTRLAEEPSVESVSEEMAVIAPVPVDGPGSAPQIPTLSGELHVPEMVLKVAENDAPQKLLFSSQSFNLNIKLDLGDVCAPQDTPLHYSAIAYAKRLGDGKRQPVGNAEGELLPAEHVSLAITEIQLQSGVYRIEGLIKLMLPLSSNKPASRLMAMTESILIEVL